MSSDNAMRKILAVAAAAVTMTAAVVPAWADGSRRAWRGSGYAIGAISRNVITPYYYGYYGSHYSYVTPDPIPGPTYVRYVYVSPVCWSLGFGYRYWVC
jgi:hypothetical protein